MAGLKFRVLLDSENSNEVFRDLLINSEDNFETFYKAILSAFNFQGLEMASFYVSNDSWDKGHEINLEDMTYGDDELADTSSIMKDSIIQDFIEEPDQKFILVYDFLRMWIFLVELIGYEKVPPAQPQVLLAIGMAPPEDSKPLENETAFLDLGGDDDDEDEDEFGFNDFDDDISDDDYSNFDSY
ncbi:MAG: hypothetical protein V4638_03960 [Bacteroidota bacterium]